VSALQAKIPDLLEVLDAEPGNFRPYPDISQAATSAVIRRDMWLCHFCGETTGKYNRVLGIGGHDRDLSSILSACLFCWQCFDPHGVSERRSADLVHCSEFSQPEISQLGLQIRALSLGTGLSLKMAQSLQSTFEERANRVAARLDGAKALQMPIDATIARLRSLKKEDPDFFSGLRVFPNGRWIHQKGELRFNRYPEMLTYWWSPESGIGNVNYILDDSDGVFLRAIREFAPDLAAIFQENGGRLTTEAKSHAELAAQLLRDAAAFFGTVAEQNPSLGRQLTENASIFNQISELVVKDPAARIGDGDKPPAAAELAVKLLRDGSSFFESMAVENPPLRAQMAENSDVFNQVADLLEQEPEGIIEG